MMVIVFSLHRCTAMEISSLRDVCARWCTEHFDAIGVSIPQEVDEQLGYHHCLQHLSQAWVLFAESCELIEDPSFPDRPAHDGTITDVRFLDKGNKAISVGADGRVCLWDIEQGRFERSVQAHAARINKCVVSNDETLMITCSDDLTACLWQCKDFKKLIVMPHPAIVSCVALSNNKEYVATGSQDGKVRIFSVIDGTCVAEYEHFSQAEQDQFFEIRAVLFTKNDTAVIAGADRIVKVWTRDTGAVKIKSEAIAFTFPCSMIIRRDGEVICGHVTGEVELLDEGPARKRKRMTGHNVDALTISPDNTFLVTGSVAPGDDMKFSAALWALDKEFALTAVRSFKNEIGVKTVAISDDKTMILTGGHMHGVLKLWSIKRFIKNLGFKAAKLLCTFPRRANAERVVDLRGFPEDAVLFASLDNELKDAIAGNYRVVLRSL